MKINFINRLFQKGKLVDKPNFITDDVKSLTNQDLRDALSLSKLNVDLIKRTISIVDFDSQEKACFSLLELAKRNIELGKLQEFRELVKSYITTDNAFFLIVKIFAELPIESYSNNVILKIIEIKKPTLDVSYIEPLIVIDRKQRVHLRAVEKKIIDSHTQWDKSLLQKNINYWEQAEKDSFHSYMKVFSHLCT